MCSVFLNDGKASETALLDSGKMQGSQWYLLALLLTSTVEVISVYMYKPITVNTYSRKRFFFPLYDGIIKSPTSCSWDSGKETIEKSRQGITYVLWTAENLPMTVLKMTRKCVRTELVVWREMCWLFGPCIPSTTKTRDGIFLLLSFYLMDSDLKRQSSTSSI